ncbi:MAG: Na+/H+ antiporter subunit E [Halopseudomonas sp.]
MPPVSRRQSPSPQRRQPRSGTWAGLALNLGIWLALWALLSNNGGWAFGVPLALLAVWASQQVRLQVGPVHLHYLPAFLGFFLTELALGGWDVARRAWHPQLPIAPRWLRYAMTSEEPRVQLLLSAMVGLLPGTFASHFQGQTLFIHALDHRQDWGSTVQRLEHHLERLLKESRP